jgi:nitrile hydratase
MVKNVDEAKSHMHDCEAHVRAVEEDLEYYRTKRFEPRIIYLARRGVVTFHDLLKAHSSLRRKHKGSAGEGKAKVTMEERVRALEDSLDDYVKGIALVSSDGIKDVQMVIEDNRKERGDYDEFFRIKKKEHGGSLKERVRRLGEDLKDYHMLLDAFTQALIERGLVRRRELERRRKALYARGGWNGARIVARAWVDPEFKSSLIERGREAVRELGIPPGRTGKLGVVENTDSVHNVIVCTLCSCYPYDLLGDTPWWYKHDSYKKRIIQNPRETIQDMFGLDVPASMQIRVHDSTSDVRYMVLPRRPPGTEGMAEEELAKLVTVESLIGASECVQPSELGTVRKTEQPVAAPRTRPD